MKLIPRLTPWMVIKMMKIDTKYYIPETLKIKYRFYQWKTEYNYLNIPSISYDSVLTMYFEFLSYLDVNNILLKFYREYEKYREHKSKYSVVGS